MSDAKLQVAQRKDHACRQRLLEAYPILEWFSYEHLPESLRAASKPFHDMAWDYARMALGADERAIIKYEPELIEGLRKLLEAKDCFVRAWKKLNAP